MALLHMLAVRETRRDACRRGRMSRRRSPGRRALADVYSSAVPDIPENERGCVPMSINRQRSTAVDSRGNAAACNPSRRARRRVRRRRCAPPGGAHARAMIRPIRGVSLAEAEVRLAVVRAGHIVRGK